MNYLDFIKSKSLMAPPCGLDADFDLNPVLFPFQSAIVKYALRRGRILLGEGCGMGKTIQQLEFCQQIINSTGGTALILAPLAVAPQTINENAQFGYIVHLCRSQSDVVKNAINITNYEMLDHFDASEFNCIVLDEGSIIKNFTGKIRNQCIEMFRETDFRMIATATPCPNDYMELGNHAEFLGIMSRTEMLATFFVHDGGETSQWRLKGHAEEEFWRWLASWSVCIRKPSDIGFSDDGYDLPPLNIHKHILPVDRTSGEFLFSMPAKTLNEQRAEKRSGMSDRVAKAKSIIQEKGGSWVIWGELNPECDELEKAIDDAVQVAGCDPMEYKEKTLNQFSDGGIDRLVTKLKIAGFGLNWQRHHQMIVSSITHSHEQLHQGICRMYRFGQLHPVDVHIILTEMETEILENLMRKQKQSDEMADQMVLHMSDAMKVNLGSAPRTQDTYNPQITMEVPPWIKSK